MLSNDNVYVAAACGKAVQKGKAAPSKRSEPEGDEGKLNSFPRICVY